MNLTPRESEVLSAIVAGKTNKQIAAEHGVSKHTIRTQLQMLSAKVGTCSRVELAVWAVRTKHA